MGRPFVLYVTIYTCIYTATDRHANWYKHAYRRTKRHTFRLRDWYIHSSTGRQTYIHTYRLTCTNKYKETYQRTEDIHIRTHSNIHLQPVQHALLNHHIRLRKKQQRSDEDTLVDASLALRQLGQLSPSNWYVYMISNPTRFQTHLPLFQKHNKMPAITDLDVTLEAELERLVITIVKFTIRKI